LFSIAALGLGLVAMLYSRLREMDRTLQLKRHRSREAGLCDLLNYAAVVADGVVIGKNGALIAGWEYTGDDNASTTDTQRDVVSVRLNQALARLGNGWMLHVDAVRTPVEVYSARGLSQFPDRVSAAIDQERRALFAERGAVYESRFVLCVNRLTAGAKSTMVSPKVTTSKLGLIDVEFIVTLARCGRPPRAAGPFLHTGQIRRWSLELTRRRVRGHRRRT
jgi:hypothetical protein